MIIFDVTRRTTAAAYNVSGANSFALSPDGHMIASVGDAGVIALIYTDLHHGLPAKANKIAIRPSNGDLTAVSYGKVATYHLFDPNSESIIASIPKYNQSSSKRVESLSLNGLRYAFTDDQAQRISLLDLSFSRVSEVTIEGNCGDVLGLSFDPDGNFLACADKSEIIVWFTDGSHQGAKAQDIQLPKDYTTTQLAASPGGRYIAAINSRGEARLWNTRSSDNISTAIPFADAKSVSFSPDGKWLSIGGQNEIRLWNLDENKIDPRRISTGGFSVKFSPDSSRLATQGNKHGGIISVWNLHDFLPEAIVIGGSDFAFTSPDTSRLTLSDSPGVFVEPFDASWALEHVCHIVNKNLTPDEWNKYLPGFDYTPTCLL